MADAAPRLHHNPGGWIRHGMWYPDPRTCTP
jgi:hypothetical protein